MKIIRAILRRPYLTLLWTAVVLLLTLTPAISMPLTPTWEFLSFDTAAHAAVFAVLAAVAWPWVRSWAVRPGLVVLVSCVALGALIEVLQYAMHQGRHAEWSDLLSDSIGVVAVLVVIGLGRMGRRRLASAAALAVVVALGASAQPAAPRVADAPDLARARQTIATLASEKMHGRGYVQQGEHLAAAYLRGRLRQLGLQPLAPDYTQPFTLDVNTFPEAMKLTVLNNSTKILDSFGHAIIESDSTVLVAGNDFIVAPESAGTLAHCTTALAMRLDTLAFTDTAYQQEVIALVDIVLSISAHLEKKPHTTLPFLILTARDEKRLKTLPTKVQETLALLPNRVVLVPKLTASLAPKAISFVRLEALDRPGMWPISKNLLPETLKFQFDAQLQRNYQTQNLAAVVRGSAQPDSFLVVTAHYDHLGMMGKSVYFPGANDNASGVALLLELAAHYARPENQPRCSMAFLLFGAEEAGLVGSAYFVQHPLLPLPRIKFLVNLDLLGTGEEGATVVNGRVHEAAYQRLMALNDAHHYLPKLTARGRAANSDHYPFSEAGVPAFFMYTRGGSTAYHDVNDQPAALSLVGFAGAYGLMRDFLDALGAATKSSSR